MLQEGLAGCPAHVHCRAPRPRQCRLVLLVSLDRARQRCKPGLGCVRRMQEERVLPCCKRHAGATCPPLPSLLASVVLFIGLQSRTSLTPLGDVADQDIPRGRGPVMAAANGGPQPAGAAGQQRSKTFALWGPAGGAGDLQRRPAARVLEGCAPPPMLLATARAAGLLPLCCDYPYTAGCCCASAAFCLQHPVEAHDDECACAVDYIGNEHAPGLTPAALRAALSRVHLDRLPEHGAGSRVLTVRGVGFEASGP